MRIRLTSVYVDDQRAALAFYTDVLGFTRHHDIPLGEHSWLTVVSPQSPNGPELLLEPADHPAVKPYRDALAEDGIPSAQFAVDDVEAEHDRLTAAGVSFTQPPTDIGPAIVAVFHDTCGNLIQLLAQKPATPWMAPPVSASPAGSTRLPVVITSHAENLRYRPAPNDLDRSACS